MGEASSRVGLVLESPEGHRLNCAIRFGFKASNNVIKYEALLAGLRLVKEMQVRRLLVNSDSQIIVSQVKGSFTAKDSSMAAYIKLVRDLILLFKKFELVQVPRLDNAHTVALPKLASRKDSKLLKIFLLNSSQSPPLLMAKI